MRSRVGDLHFFSATYRLFRLQGLDASSEDYGQAVRYRGTLPHHPDRLVLDKHHLFEAGKLLPVCGNTYRMLAESRFKAGFDFFGDDSCHLGIFAGCGEVLPFGGGVDGSEVGTSDGTCC